jgi:endonuclease-3
MKSRAPVKKSAKAKVQKKIKQVSEASKDTRAERAHEILKVLGKVYPDAKCELNFTTPLELLVATILSAQCTDVRVNLVTPTIFKKFKTAKDYATCDQAELEKLIHSTGFYRNKAINIIKACQRMVDVYEGKLPNTMEDLTTLAGVGRKTANVLLNAIWGMNEGVIVDTHVTRLSGRLGLSNQRDPEKIEQDLMKLVPREKWCFFSHLIVWHGRRRCDAKKPDCLNCEIQKICPSFPVLSQKQNPKNSF